MARQRRRLLPLLLPRLLLGRLSRLSHRRPGPPGRDTGLRGTARGGPGLRILRLPQTRTQILLPPLPRDQTDLPPPQATGLLPGISSSPAPQAPLRL